MLSKTHLTVGVATALAVSPGRTAGEVFAAVIGGALGGVLCDVECKDLPGRKDVFAGRLGAGALTVLLLAAGTVLLSAAVAALSSVMAAYRLSRVDPGIALREGN